VSEQNAPPQGETENSGEPMELQERGLLRDFWLFLIDNKKWWLAPILLALLLIGLLVVLSDTGPGPFIYPLM